MVILFGIKVWYSKSSKSMAVSIARSWLLKKNLHQSVEEQNFVSNYRNISGKTFRSDLSLAENDFSDHVFIYYYNYYYYYYYNFYLEQCWIIKS